MPFRPINTPEEFITPENVTDVVAWLAGDGSATLSGSQIAVDRAHLEHPNRSDSTDFQDDSRRNAPTGRVWARLMPDKPNPGSGG
jgi:hypothetical protein